jgi:hypothetical protein
MSCCGNVAGRWAWPKERKSAGLRLLRQRGVEPVMRRGARRGLEHERQQHQRDGVDYDQDGYQPVGAVYALHLPHCPVPRIAPRRGEASIPRLRHAKQVAAGQSGCYQQGPWWGWPVRRGQASGGRMS